MIRNNIQKVSCYLSQKWKFSSMRKIDTPEILQNLTQQPVLTYRCFWEKLIVDRSDCSPNSKELKTGYEALKEAGFHSQYLLMDKYQFHRSLCCIPKCQIHLLVIAEFSTLRMESQCNLLGAASNNLPTYNFVFVVLIQVTVEKFHWIFLIR